MNILITGGSSGIGLSLIQLLTEAGHSVISASRNSVSTFKNTNVNLNNKTKEYGITALHQLVVMNNFDYLKKIVELGADITLTDFLGNNVIHFAMIENNIKLAKYFINMDKIKLNNTLLIIDEVQNIVSEHGLFYKTI